MTRPHPFYVPTASDLRATTSPSFLARIRETEYVLDMEARLELESLVTGDIAYHPLGSPA